MIKPDLQRMAVQAAMKAMFSNGYISINNVADAAESIGKPFDRNSSEFQLLRTVHCVDFKMMNSALKEAVTRIVVEQLELDVVDVNFKEGVEQVAAREANLPTTAKGLRLWLKS